MTRRFFARIKGFESLLAALVVLIIGAHSALSDRLREAAQRFLPAAARRALGNDGDLLNAAFLDALDLRAALGNCSTANLSTNQPGISV